MNIYSLIILATLVFGFIVESITEVLNLRALRSDIPGEFASLYDPDAYKKSQEYTRTWTRLRLITTAFELTITLVFWFAGGFNILDRMVRALKTGPILAGLIYVGILILGRAVLSLPFGVYGTFVIENRFGFNRTTALTYIADILKALLLGVLLGAPLLSGVLALFQSAGNAAWLWCWLATTLFVLFVQYIAPTWIMPLFNKYVPLADGELKEAILAYARSVSFPLKNLFVMDGSRRSTKANAFFTGFGKNKRIALFDTLIEKHPVPGLVAILAHEIGHYKKRHIIQGLLISVLHMGLLFYLLSVFINQPGLFKAFYLQNASIYAGLVIFGMLYSPLEMVLSVLMHMLSRRNEYEADRFAAETTRDPASMIEALKTLSRHNLSNLTPHPLHVFLNYSHPPVLMRIQALRQVPARAAEE